MSPDSSKHETQLLTAVLQIQEDIAVIKSAQKETSRQLFGNGQPGWIDRLDGRLKTLELLDAKEEGEKNSNRRWSGFISAAVSTLITWAIETFVHRK